MGKLLNLCLFVVFFSFFLNFSALQLVLDSPTQYEKQSQKHVKSSVTPSVRYRRMQESRTRQRCALFTYDQKQQREINCSSAKNQSSRNTGNTTTLRLIRTLVKTESCIIHLYFVSILTILKSAFVTLNITNIIPFLPRDKITITNRLSTRFEFNFNWIMN